MQRRIKINSRDKEALDQIKLLLECNLQQDYSLLQLCKKAGLNQDKLKKGFKLLYGSPPLSYQRQIRLLESRRLLLETEQSVSEIAYAVGYEQACNFCTAFRKFFGCSPLSIRTDKKYLIK